MTETSFRTIDAAVALEHVVVQLSAVRGRASLPTVFTETSLDVIRQLPTWVARVALLKSRGTWWLWCEPRKGGRAGDGQLVMDVPAGRYLVDILDTRAHAWFSRESAAGAPLVAGLPATPHAVLVKIRRVSTVAAGPRE